jgi:hypothetical protein
MWYRCSPEKRYIIWGKEVGEKGTPHLQIYVQYDRPVELAKVTAFWDECHVEVAKGNAKVNYEYCSKDKEFEELGEIKGLRAGKRNDWVEILRMVKSGCPFNEIAEEFPGHAARNEKGIKRLKYMIEPEDKMDWYVPRGWQREVMKIVTNKEVDRRTINWIYDTKGGSGKTSTAKWLAANMGAMLVGNEKSADVAFAFNRQKIVVFDLVRASQEHINYEIIEKIKNGCVFSGKYESELKLAENPHVVVFSNDMPDIMKMSHDRWNILEIVDDSLIKIVLGHEGQIPGAPQDDGPSTVRRN